MQTAGPQASGQAAGVMASLGTAQGDVASLSEQVQKLTKTMQTEVYQHLPEQDLPRSTPAREMSKKFNLTTKEEPASGPGAPNVGPRCCMCCFSGPPKAPALSEEELADVM